MDAASGEVIEVELQNGVVIIEGNNGVFMEPVRVLNSGYDMHDVKFERYYSRAFFTSVSMPSSGVTNEGSDTRKRKRKRVYNLNEKEVLAENRHQEVRSVILKAHEAFQATVAPSLRNYITFDGRDDCVPSPSKSCSSMQNLGIEEGEVNFVELAALWQAPLYEFSFSKGQVDCEEEESRTTPMFNTIIKSSSRTSEVAECGACKYLLPKSCTFLISDISEVHRLIPVGDSKDGFNLMVIDPPWENKSVHRKSLYPTLPNKYLLSLPVKQLAHADGALVALWITNREKLRHFAETELFPAWGVKMAAVWYWLKKLRCLDHLDLTCIALVR
uniref:Methyltransferase-like protein 2 n=1 Tax=Physcomitrium patens TaxID=3218 RepID=A0A7I4EZ53_PHYPA